MDVNWIAVVVAAVSAFVAGGIWYGPLFGKKWMTLNGFTEEELKQGGVARIYGLAFILSLIAAAVFAMFLGRDPGLAFATGAGFSAGLCWVAASFGISYLFEHRPLGLWLVNGGYHTVQFTLYGLVFGLMG
jgi:hypothetical protein